MNLLDQKDSINVDISACFYNRSRVLYTRDTSSTVRSGNHNAVIIDGFTPLSSGESIFAPVWKYMLGICDIASSISNSDLLSSAIIAYPNPAHNVLCIKSEHLISRLELLSLSGKALAVFEPNSKTFNLDVASYQGLFFLRISTVNGGKEVVKVVVE
mgnify:CR=1 FL=1